MQKAFGSLIIDLKGIELEQDEKELLEHPLVGGVILFTRNYQFPEQLQNLIRSIRQVNKPLLIMVDQEGGRVQRFRNGFTPIPPAAVYGKRYDENPHLGLQLAETGGWLMAYELVSKGIDLSLAPILDLNKGLSSIIGDRAFHQNAAIAVKLAAAYIQGMKRAGMAATGKHFPGHGSVVPDSHLELPVDSRIWDEVRQDDLQPFIAFIKGEIPALMTAHILFPQVDKMPVSFSRFWLKNILREQLGYQGVVISDDLNMKGAEIMGNYADRMCLAREAGCDIILLCNNRPAILQVLDRVVAAEHQLDPSKHELLRADFSLAHQVDQHTWEQQRDFLLTHYEMA